MASVLDTDCDCSIYLTALIQLGFTTIIRYYSRSPAKRLSEKEAIAVTRAGLKLCTVYQNRQRSREDFTTYSGEAAGRDADDYARNVIYQPTGSAIYFSVDYDASEDDVTKSIRPFFEAVKQVMTAAGSARGCYRVGVYGSGRVCRMLTDAGLAELTWLSQSTGFAEYRDWLQGGRWNLRQNLSSTVAGLRCDTNEANPANPDFGAFSLETSAAMPERQPQGPTPIGCYSVIARSLNVRSGPSIAFAVRNVLRFGTMVNVLELKEDWALVSVEGDSAADGYCLSTLLHRIQS